jgi:hypothetical protein
MNGKEADSAVDLSVEADRQRHLVHQTDASRRDRSNTRSDLVPRPRPAQHGAAIVLAARVLALEPTLDLTFETPKLSS